MTPALMGAVFRPADSNQHLPPARSVRPRSAYIVVHEREETTKSREIVAATVDVEIREASPSRADRWAPHPARMAQHPPCHETKPSSPLT